MSEVPSPWPSFGVPIRVSTVAKIYKYSRGTRASLMRRYHDSAGEVQWQSRENLRFRPSREYQMKHNLDQEVRGSIEKTLDQACVDANYSDQKEISEPLEWHLV